MTTGRPNRSYIFSILTILLALIVAIFIIEIAIRSFYYQVNAPYNVGIYHFYVHKLVPWFGTGFRSAGKKLNREAWEASYAERSMPVPASGPREGYWGARIDLKNHPDCGYLRYCAGGLSLPGLIEIDHQGMQHAGRRDESDVHILIVGGSVAFGAYASSVENTYFERLRKALNRHSVNVSISVLATGAWVSGDEVAAFAEIGLKLTPDLVIFLNGLNDLTIPMYPVRELNPQERVRSYLRNMSIAGVLAERSGVTMMSEVAYFVKDVVGPNGCVSIVVPQDGEGGAQKDDVSNSADIDQHTKTNALKIHYAAVDEEKNFTKPDEIMSMEDEPDHQELCDREQAYFLQAIREDLDLSESMDAAVNSLRIVLAAEESIETEQAVHLA